MNCEEYKYLINLFIDDDLTTDEKIDLFKHLSECTDCREFIDAMVKIRNVTKSENIKVPDELDDEIFSEISAKKSIYSTPFKYKSKKPFWAKRLSISTPVAAFAAIILVAIGIFFFTHINRQIDTMRAQQTSFTMDPDSMPVKYILVKEIPPIEIIGHTSKPKKVNSAIYNK